MRYSVVDMGSNTVRLAVNALADGESTRLLDQQKTVGLAGYVEGWALTPQGVRAAAAALREYSALAQALDAAPLHVFATASLRNITNTAQVVEDLRQATGLTVEVLSGAEEARLSFLGTLASSDLTDGLLADIGGGSTELVPFSGRQALGGTSLPFGSLSLFKHHVAGLFPTPAEREALFALAYSGAEKVRGDGPCRPVLLGAGGTIESLSLLSGQLFERAPGHFTAPEAAAMLERLSTGGRDALFSLLRAAPDRVHTLIPGLIILTAVLQAYGVETVQLSRTDLRDGYLRARLCPDCAPK